MDNQNHCMSIKQARLIVNAHKITISLRSFINSLKNVQELSVIHKITDTSSIFTKNYYFTQEFHKLHENVQELSVIL